MSTSETSSAVAAAERPKVTLPQIIATVTAGVPIIANLLAAFGVYTLSHVEQDALQQALGWGVSFAGLLVLGDAGLRSARNHAVAKGHMASAIETQAMASMSAPKAATLLGDHYSGAATSARAIAGDNALSAQSEEDAEGPGDLFDPMPHVPVAHPADVPPDEVDRPGEEDSLGFAAAQPEMAIRRPERPLLTERQFAMGKNLLLRYMNWALAHPGSVHYTQDATMRWHAISHDVFIRSGGKLEHGDCSSTSTWLLRNWAFLFGVHADVFNGTHYTGGYTGTLVHWGIQIHHDRNLRFGDLIFYGNQGGGVPEHVAMYIGGGMVWSHGSDAGPFKLPIDYRPDRVQARRYFRHHPHKH